MHDDTAIHVRLPRDLRQRLHAAAHASDRCLSQVVRGLIREYVQRVEAAAGADDEVQR